MDLNKMLHWDIAFFVIQRSHQVIMELQPMKVNVKPTSAATWYCVWDPSSPAPAADPPAKRPKWSLDLTSKPPVPAPITDAPADENIHTPIHTYIHT